MGSCRIFYPGGRERRDAVPPTGRFVRICVPKRQFGEKPENVARILVIHKYDRGILKRVYKPETIRMQRLAQSLKYNTSKERSKVDKQQGFFIYLSLG
ncbi:MAG: hypothetical protein KIC70_06070 [Alistipes indistinctus]|nr:hypothetical protein [Alistipes indistinctus]